jgi:hypothetical protein
MESTGEFVGVVANRIPFVMELIVPHILVYGPSQITNSVQDVAGVIAQIPRFLVMVKIELELGEILIEMVQSAKDLPSAVLAFAAALRNPIIDSILKRIVMLFEVPHDLPGLPIIEMIRQDGRG